MTPDAFKKIREAVDKARLLFKNNGRYAEAEQDMENALALIDAHPQAEAKGVEGRLEFWSEQKLEFEYRADHHRCAGPVRQIRTLQNLIEVVEAERDAEILLKKAALANWEYNQIKRHDAEAQLTTPPATDDTALAVALAEICDATMSAFDNGLPLSKYGRLGNAASAGFKVLHAHPAASKKGNP